jgi:hypothetical protein
LTIFFGQLFVVDVSEGSKSDESALSLPVEQCVFSLKVEIDDVVIEKFALVQTFQIVRGEIEPDRFLVETNCLRRSRKQTGGVRRPETDGKNVQLIGTDIE